MTGEKIMDRVEDVLSFEIYFYADHEYTNLRCVCLKYKKANYKHRIGHEQPLKYNNTHKVFVQ